jgi:hypothetical protein
MIILSLCSIAIIATSWPVITDKIKQRNKIRNFVIKVNGPIMTDDKFGCLNDDINRILEGSKLSEVVGDGNKELTHKNIIGITDMPGQSCHYFVVWFRR